MKEIIEELISASAIKKRTQELADQIYEDCGGKPVVMLCVLKGGVIFMVDLAKELKADVELSFISVSSYGDTTESSGNIKLSTDISDNLEGKNVIIVEDILDTGRTLKFLVEYIKTKNPGSIKVCTLLDKPDRRLVDVDVDYVGFTIPDKFVVGYGLDYAQKYRNLKFVGVLNFVDAE